MLFRSSYVISLPFGVTGLVAFFIVTPFSRTFTPKGSDITYDVSCVPLDWVGSKGLFLGMIVALVAVTIYAKILKIGLNTAPTTLEPFIPKNQNPCKNRYAITIAGKVLPNFNNGTCKILNMKLCKLP